MVFALTILGIALSTQALGTSYAHYFELRNSAHTNYVYSSPNSKQATLFKIRKGQILKADLTAEQVKIKQKKEIENNPYWIKLSSGQGWIRYHWSQYIALSSTYGMLELELADHSKKDLITIFHRPGPISWRNCSERPDICVAFPTQNSKLELVDSEFKEIENKKLLFYKMEYSYKLHDKTLAGVGWAWSGFFKRKLSLPEYRSAILSGLDEPLGSNNLFNPMLKKRSILKSEDVEKLLQQQSENTVKQMSVFGIESTSRFNRWMTTPQKRNVANENSNKLSNAMESVINLGVDFHFISDIQNMNLSGNEYSGTYNQQSLRMGLGGIMPIFLDFEIMGTFFLSLPLASNDTSSGSMSLIDFEQILMISTPLSIDSTPVKMGMAGNVAMFVNTPFETGYNALLSLKLAAVVEAPEYFSHAMLGPVINSTGTSFSNLELVLRGGYRLSKEDPFNSWSLFSEYRNMSYSTNDNKRRASQSIISLGVHKGF